MDQRQELAWKLAERRVDMLAHHWPERIHQRDCVGTALADVVSITRLVYVGVTGRPIPKVTEMERRAVVCARRRLKARIDQEPS